jgi:hypothetical protein
MERSPFLPLPEGMVIGQVELTPTQLTVEVIATQPCACCPGCGNLSDSVHCQYQRTVHDVPCGGRKVVLRLRVRKFVCRSAPCPRKVFAERLPELVQPWARVSNRLLEELKAIGLAASAEVSERLAPRLGMKVKAPTLLRASRGPSQTLPRRMSPGWAWMTLPSDGQTPTEPFSSTFRRDGHSISCPTAPLRPSSRGLPGIQKFSWSVGIGPVPLPMR